MEKQKIFEKLKGGKVGKKGILFQVYKMVIQKFFEILAIPKSLKGRKGILLLQYLLIEKKRFINLFFYYIGLV